MPEYEFSLVCIDGNMVVDIIDNPGSKPYVLVKHDYHNRLVDLDESRIADCYHDLKNTYILSEFRRCLRFNDGPVIDAAIKWIRSLDINA